MYSYGGSSCFSFSNIPITSPLSDIATQHTILSKRQLYYPLYEPIMDISYNIGIKIEEEVHTFRVPLGTIRLETIRWLLLHVPSVYVLDGIVINALNSIAHEPMGDVAVDEICKFFTELFYLELDWQASNIHQVRVNVNSSAPRQTVLTRR